MKCSLVLLFLFFICPHAFAQLVGKERIDSIRDANQQRISAMREANKRRTDSIKQITQARKDSLAILKEIRTEKAKEKKKSKRLQDDVFEQDDVSSYEKKNLAKRDSLAQKREKFAEKRKQENIAKKNSLVANRKKVNPPISQEISFGYRLASDGWSFFANRGFIKTGDLDHIHTLFLWTELSEKKHPKERLTQNENFQRVSSNDVKPIPYKYGKINNFYAFKIGIGNTKPLTGHLDKRSMIISWTYQAGLSIGMLKPYYLDVLVKEGNTIVRKFAKYSDEIQDSFLDLKNQGSIVGGSDFTKGLKEIKIQPGLSFRSGFYFDFTPSEKIFLGIEIGASLDVYTKQIPIMVNADNRAAFFNIYADVRFGKRWKQKSNYVIEDVDD
jgi:hypothetical protein